MPSKKHKSEEIIGKLFEVDHVGPGRDSRRGLPADRCHGAAPLQVAKRIWRPEGRPGSRMKDLEKENLRLRRAVSDLTLEKLILQEVAKGNFRASSGDGAASTRLAA